MEECRLKATIANYDDLMSSCKAVIEAGVALGLPDYMIQIWVLDYLRRNIRIFIQK